MVMFTINRHLVFMTYLNDVEKSGTEFYYFPDLKRQKKRINFNTHSWTNSQRQVMLMKNIL